MFASPVADPQKTKLRDVSFQASLCILITFKLTIRQGLEGMFSFFFSAVGGYKLI